MLILFQEGLKVFAKMLRIQFVTLYRVALKRLTVRVEHQLNINALKHRNMIVHMYF